MASNQTAEVSVRILIDEEKNRVVCAEAGYDFVDILFSFLTLPMGTIVRLIRKQQAEIGCMNSLYQSVENLSTACLWTDACKDMLLQPRTPFETICRGLKVNVNDTEPTKYFICSGSDLACLKSDRWSNGVLSNYVNAKCNGCGKLMNKEITVSGSESSANAMEGTDGIFVRPSTAYIVSDDLRVMESTPGALIELLGNVGIKDVNSLQERVLKVGSEEILNLLECSLLSESPLTDVFYSSKIVDFKRRKLLKPRDHEFLSCNVPETSTNGSMAVKIMLRKSDGKALYAEAMEDFVDLLFSFLTIPLGNVVRCLNGDSSLGCVDNLYRSIQGLNKKWFTTLEVPWSYSHQCSNDLLLNPGLAPKFRCSSQPFQLEERTTGGYHCHNKLSSDVCSLIIGVSYSGARIGTLTLIDPKSPKCEASFEEFVKRPASFLVSDGLVVLPSVGITSSISYLKGLDVPMEDIEERVIKINKLETMASNRTAEVSVRILIDEKKNRVVCAEAGNDFVDILFSFLTLPMGTIVRLIRKLKAEIGCMSNLYGSVENLSTASLWTDACKDMLLHPRSPFETFCRGLKVNVNDTKPSKYFICSDLVCIRTLGDGVLSNYVNAKCCSCGKLMKREISVSDANSMEDTDGVFVKRSTAYIVSDNLKVMINSPGALVELLSNVGIKDVNSLQERVLKVGSKEILNLLERSLLSESPLTDVFLPNKTSNSKSHKLLKPRDHRFLPQNIPGTATNGSMTVKIMLRKSDGKALYAEAMEDFADLLFSFLTIPLGNVVRCLKGDSSLGCVDNLYRSIQDLNKKWFATHRVPWSRYHQRLDNLLLDPGLAPKFKCSSQPFQLGERIPNFYYCHNKLSMDVLCATNDRCHVNCGEVLANLTLIDPKSPNWETSFEEFVKRPTLFLISNGLVVSPSVNITSSISFLKGLDVPIEDIEEREIKINKQEALNLLKASLITTSALTSVLNLHLKKPKQEM